MSKKWIAIVLTLVLALGLAACGEGEETTLSGMVVSVDGSVISLVEMDSGTSGKNFGEGGKMEMPEGVEGFRGFGEFNPEDFEGMTMPEGVEGFQGFGEFNPEDFEGMTMPEGMEGFQGFGEFNPEDFEGMTMPEGGTFPQWGSGEMPEGMTIPEGMTRPENGERPGFGGMGGFDSNAEKKEVDISGAHISVQIDGGKASGSMDDIKAGAFVTVTMNGKGKVTNVLVTSTSGFGGGRRPAN